MALKHSPWVLRSSLFLFLVLNMSACTADRSLDRLHHTIQQDEILLRMTQMHESDFEVIRTEILDSALTRIRFYENLLLTFSNKSLSAQGIDLRDSLNRTLLKQFAEWNNWRTDPSIYHLGEMLQRTLNQSDRPLEERLRLVERQLEHTPPFFKQARQNLQSPLPTRMRLAVQKQIQSLQFFSNELRDSIDRSKLPPNHKQDLHLQVTEAKLQVKDYLAFCESLWFEHLDSLMNND